MDENDRTHGILFYGLAVFDLRGMSNPVFQNMYILRKFLNRLFPLTLFVFEKSELICYFVIVDVLLCDE